MSLHDLKKALQNKTAKAKKSGPDRPPRARTEAPAPIHDPREAAANRKLGDLRTNESAVRKIVRASASIAAMITNEDREKAIQVIREAMNATVWVYDPGTRRHIHSPDWKTRLAAVTLGLAYGEGLPVKRIAAVVHDHTTPEDRLRAFQDSPQMTNAIRALSGLGVSMVAEGDVIDITPVQQSGGQTGGVASREDGTDASGSGNEQ